MEQEFGVVFNIKKAVSLCPYVKVKVTAPNTFDYARSQRFNRTNGRLSNPTHVYSPQTPTSKDSNRL